MTKAPTKGEIRRDKVLLALRANPDSTAKEIGEEQGYLWNLEQLGLVKKSGARKGARGRPAVAYKLDTKGSKRASSLAKRVAR